MGRSVLQQQPPRTKKRSCSHRAGRPSLATPIGPRAVAEGAACCALIGRGCVRAVRARLCGEWRPVIGWRVVCGWGRGGHVGAWGCVAVTWGRGVSRACGVSRGCDRVTAGEFSLRSPWDV